jgi:hypothetical protein
VAFCRRRDEAAAYVSAFVRDLLATGFIRDELVRAGQDPSLAMPADVMD